MPLSGNVNLSQRGGGDRPRVDILKELCQGRSEVSLYQGADLGPLRRRVLLKETGEGLRVRLWDKIVQLRKGRHAYMTISKRWDYRIPWDHIRATRYPQKTSTRTAIHNTHSPPD